MTRFRAKRATGFTLIEVMLATAVIGLLMAVAASLVSSGIRSWLNGLLQVTSQQDVRTARMFLVNSLNTAQAASVLVGTSNTGETVGSMVAYADVYGDTIQVWQAGDKLMAAVWKPVTYTPDEAFPPTVPPTRAWVLINSGVSSFRAYYPNNKDFSNINLSLCLAKAARYAKVPVQILVSDSIELRNP
jgi:prepilin-type N-terminal cleavage/methylation domain-containing protein